MKLFIDTADLEEIREAASWGIIDGVTTNPTLMAKSIRNKKEDSKKEDERFGNLGSANLQSSIVKEICSLVDGPVSAEVTALDADGMVKEARELSAIHQNVAVKVPMTVEGIKAVGRLSAEGIKTNVTLVFSASQALLAAKAGASFVSPFVGRIDDRSGDGMEVAAEILAILAGFEFPTEVIVASVRHPRHVLQAALMGADIATVPFSVLKKLFDHPLTDLGIERFLADWKAVSG